MMNIFGLGYLGIKNVSKLFEQDGVGDAINVKGWDSFELFKYGLLWARQGLSFQELGLFLGIESCYFCYSNVRN